MFAHFSSLLRLTSLSKSCSQMTSSRIGRTPKVSEGEGTSTEQDPTFNRIRVEAESGPNAVQDHLRPGLPSAGASHKRMPDSAVEICNAAHICPNAPAPHAGEIPNLAISVRPNRSSRRRDPITSSIVCQRLFPTTSLHKGGTKSL